MKKIGHIVKTVELHNNKDIPLTSLAGYRAIVGLERKCNILSLIRLRNAIVHAIKLQYRFALYLTVFSQYGPLYFPHCFFVRVKLSMSLYF